MFYIARELVTFQQHCSLGMLDNITQVILQPHSHSTMKHAACSRHTTAAFATTGGARSLRGVENRRSQRVENTNLQQQKIFFYPTYLFVIS